MELATLDHSILYTDNLEDEQYMALASWITISKDLPNISGIKTYDLDPLELQRWFKSALIAIVIKENDLVIGFATLSKEEVALPESTLEVCHCVVHPAYRRIYNGSSIIICLASFAKKKGYKDLVARVVKSNIIAQDMFDSLRWNKLKDNQPNNDETVVWFHKKLHKNG